MSKEFRAAELASLVNGTDNIEAIIGIWFRAAEERLGMQVGAIAAQRLLDIQESVFGEHSNRISSCTAATVASHVVEIAYDELAEGYLTESQYEHLRQMYYLRPDSISVL
jgi:hypothetical protein